MAGDDDLLEELRLVFRDELADHLATLERELVAISRPDLDPARLSLASAEIHRAVHSLKGAARAVGYEAIERFCHAFESKLTPLRSATIDSLPELKRYARLVHSGLRACASSLDRAGTPDVEALAARLAEVDGQLEGDAPRPRSITDPELRHEPAGDSGSAGAGETTRVSVERLDGVVVAAEAVIASLDERAAKRAHASAISDSIHLLHEELRAMENLPHGGSAAQLNVVLGRSHRLLTALSTLEAERAEDERLAWQNVRSSIDEVLVRSRALRVAPFDGLATWLEHAAYEAAGALGRPVVMSVAGRQLGLGRRVLDGLREPLLHLVRNAIDHGIESADERKSAGKPALGTLELSLALHGADATITLRDDGRGIDREAVIARARSLGIQLPTNAPDAVGFALLFEPGFTLREVVTPLSGRGIGLDVVRQRVSALRGAVRVESRAGQGTTFTLTVPMDLSSMRGLVMRAGDLTAVLPSSSVVKLVRVPARSVLVTDGRLYLPDKASPIPLADLGEVLEVHSPTPQRAIREREQLTCVVIEAAGRAAALCVDALIEERYVIIKSPAPRVRRMPFLLGATVLGGGEVALVLNPTDLANNMRPAQARPVESERERARVPHVLVVDDSITTRQLERAILMRAGYQVTVATDGAHAWSLLERQDFDLVLSDLEMPRLDGFQLIERIRKHKKTSKLPVVLMTALVRDVDRKRALDLGANAYFMKSGFDQENLLDAIAKLL